MMSAKKIKLLDPYDQGYQDGLEEARLLIEDKISYIEKSLYPYEGDKYKEIFISILLRLQFSLNDMKKN